MSIISPLKIVFEESVEDSDERIHELQDLKDVVNQMYILLPEPLDPVKNTIWQKIKKLTGW